jgi:hypothetical protein
MEVKRTIHLEIRNLASRFFRIAGARSPKADLSRVLATTRHMRQTHCRQQLASQYQPPVLNPDAVDKQLRLLQLLVHDSG